MFPWCKDSSQIVMLWWEWLGRLKWRATGKILLNDLDNKSPLEKQMADETVKKIKQLTTSMLTESHIDEMTVKWLSQTPNPLRIAEFYTLTKIHRPTLEGRAIISG